MGIVKHIKKCSTSCMPGQGAEFTPCRVKADKIYIQGTLQVDNYQRIASNDRQL
jgi:hypothetical protein